MRNPFRYFNSSPEMIRLAVMMYIRYPLSLRQVEDLLFERGIDICHETVRFWWNRFGPMFAAEIRKRRVHHSSYSQWRWHLDEVFVKINGEAHYLWRAVDHEGEALEVFATKRRDRRAALKFLKRTMKHYGRPRSIETDRLRSYGTAMKAMGIVERQECGRWLNNRAENSHQPFRRREGAMAKFRDVKTLQKFAAVHASIHNLDEAVVPQVPRQCRSAPASRPGLQSCQLHADTGLAEGSRALVDDDITREAGEDRCQGGQPWPLRDLSTGRSGGSERLVRYNLTAD